jgi:hypothetical protein
MTMWLRWGRNSDRILMGKPFGKVHSEDQEVYEKIILSYILGK